MDLELVGKRALITGSSSDIGAEIARMLAAEGVAVAGSCYGLSLGSVLGPEGR
jgi:NAD(P)-dependent dehydrogenase (short-subunit alcohol dehydrogenase family)